VRPPLDRLDWFVEFEIASNKKMAASCLSREGQIQAEHLNRPEKGFNCFPDTGPGFE